MLLGDPGSQTMTLEEMKNIDLKTVDRESLVDIRDVHIDTSLPVAERVKSYIQQIKNPYVFRCGNTVVKVSYTEGGPSLAECFIGMLGTSCGMTPKEIQSAYQDYQTGVAQKEAQWYQEHTQSEVAHE